MNGHMTYCDPLEGDSLLVAPPPRAGSDPDEVGLVALDERWRVAYASAGACRQLGCDSEQAPVRFEPVARHLRAAMASNGHPDEQGVGRPVPVTMNGSDRALRCEVHRLEHATAGWHLVVLREDAGFSAIGPSPAANGRDSSLASTCAATVHDVRGGLHAIALNVEVIKQAGLDGDDPATLRRALARHASAIQREMSRIERAMAEVIERVDARDPAEPVIFDLRDVLADVVDVLGPRADAQGTTLTRTMPDREAPVRGFPERLTQAVLNLGNNGLEAMGGGGTLRLRLLSDDPDGRMRIEVSDSGPGVPDSLRARIWHPRYTTKAHGTGIGLGLTRSIAREHGGVVFLRPAGPRRGACFEMWLPRAASMETRPAAGEESGL